MSREATNRQAWTSQSPSTDQRRTRSRRRRSAAYNSEEMVRPSRDRLNLLARDLLDALSRSRAVVLLKDREVVRQAIAHALTDELRREEEREDSARRRLATMRPAPKAGTPEWEELFRRFVEEEYLREGLDT